MREGPDSAASGPGAEPWDLLAAARRDRISIAIAVVATVAISLGLWAVLLGAEQWARSARPATCLATHCFCEAVDPGPVAQPANTVSSLVFLALGAWALAAAVRGRGRLGGSSRLLVPAVALATCLVGLASAFFHATLTFVGQYLDVMSMYLLGALLVCGALWRRGTWAEGPALAAFLTLAVALGVAQYLEPELRRVMFAAVLVPGIVLELTTRVTGVPGRHPRNRLVRAGVLLLVVAYALWLLDQARVLCWPESLLQGHAAWHTLTAVAAVLLVGHYALTPRPG